MHSGHGVFQMISWKLMWKNTFYFHNAYFCRWTCFLRTGHALFDRCLEEKGCSHLKQETRNMLLGFDDTLYNQIYKYTVSQLLPLKSNLEIHMKINYRTTCRSARVDSSFFTTSNWRMWWDHERYGQSESSVQSSWSAQLSQSLCGGVTFILILKGFVVSVSVMGTFFTLSVNRLNVMQLLNMNRMSLFCQVGKLIPLMESKFFPC